ncbi:MAG: pantoate--beta-alanine ligase [Planctomycetota bacterium]
MTQTIDETRHALTEMTGRQALVPTMGALHEGHLSLVRRARELADHVTVSIFVNPTQFGPKEDLARYPRPLERDLELLRDEGVGLVWLPGVDDVYPPEEHKVIVDVPALTTILEGAHRPGHFVGVCRVVAKLLGVFQPNIACFGLKDYQQLMVIQAMAEGLCLPVEIVPCELVRDEDGLALSSRNAYLSMEQRSNALSLYRALEGARRMIEAGEEDPRAVETLMRREMEIHGVEVDYAVVRYARTLAEMDSINPNLAPLVCLVAGRLGDIRLIDNTLINAMS